MSQMEQDFRHFLSKHPEIEKCYAAGLLNRRSLARHLIRQGIAKSNQLEAVVAMLRRFPFAAAKKESLALLAYMKVQIKDHVAILDFEKEKALLQELKKVIDATHYDRGETLKVVVGSASLKLFVDEHTGQSVKELASRFTLGHQHKDVSEVSILFPEEARTTKGVISLITRELYLNDILILEMLTATPELLLYLSEKDVVKAYEVLKSLAAGPSGKNI